MKKVLAIILVLLTLFTTASCGMDRKTSLKYACTSDEFFYPEMHIDKGYDIDTLEPDEQFTKIFNKICSQEVIFINSAYNLNFTVEDIPVYVLDFDDLTLNINQGAAPVAFYEQALNVVLINSKYTKNDTYVYAVLTHEAFHYIFKYNNKDTKFGLELDSTHFLGTSLTEGFTNILAIQFLAVTNNYAAGTVVGSAYYLETSIVEMLESIPDLYYLYLTNNVAAISEIFNSRIWQYTTVDPLNKITPFEYFLFQMESFCNMNSYHAMQPTVEKYATYNYEFGYATFEMLFAIARDSSDVTKDELVSVYDSTFEVWNISEENPRSNFMSSIK